jgi:putative MATE family efflux protein
MTSPSLTTAPISRLIRQLAVPACTGILFNTLYNVVDTWYAGLISTEAIASLTISFPVFFIIIAVAHGLGTGTTALVAHELGSGNRDQAELFLMQAILLALLVSILVTLTGWALAPNLFGRLGATGTYLDTALAYMNPIYAGTVFFVFSALLNGPLAASGDTVSYRNTLVVGCLLNIALDPWFIYGGFGLPPMGVFGIALATVLIQAGSAAYLLSRNLRAGHLSLHCLRRIRPQLKTCLAILRQALPATLDLATVGIGIFIITDFVTEFGKVAVAAYGIAIRIEQIVLLPLIGLNIATLSVVGQNAGARLPHRAREAVHTSLKYGFVTMCLGGILILAFAPQLMQIFTREPAVTQVGVGYLRVAAFLLCAFLFVFVGSSALQGMKKPMYAVWIGLGRQVILPLLLLPYLLANTPLGIYSIWLGVAIITTLAAAITYALVRYELARLPRS